MKPAASHGSASAFCLAPLIYRSLESAPSLILTSDPGDLERLLEGEPEAGRVVVIGV